MRKHLRVLKPEEPPMPPDKILLIDDEESIRLTMGDFLEDAGYGVLAAANGRQGLELLQKENPSVVLTDINMPVLDGLKVIEIMRQTTPLTPALVISGAETADHIINALRLGAWDYIPKPVLDLNFLHDRIRIALARAAQLRLEKSYHEQLQEDVREKTAKLRAEISARKIAQRQLEYEACHDSLTRIGNRSLLLNDLKRLASPPLLPDFRETSRRFGLLLFNINALKNFNDTFGYTFGDQLLAHLGKRFASFSPDD